jgi:hypothetical protein
MSLSGMDSSLRQVIKYQEGDFPGTVLNDLMQETGNDTVERLRRVKYDKYPWMESYLMAYGVAVMLLSPIIESAKLNPSQKRDLLVAGDVLAAALQAGTAFVEGDIDPTIRKQMGMIGSKNFMGQHRQRRLAKVAQIMAKVGAKTASGASAAEF